MGQSSFNTGSMGKGSGQPKFGQPSAQNNQGVPQQMDPLQENGMYSNTIQPWDNAQISTGTSGKGSSGGGGKSGMGMEGSGKGQSSQGASQAGPTMMADPQGPPTNVQRWKNDNNY